MPKPIHQLSGHEFALARVELLEAWKRLDLARDRFTSSVKSDSQLPAWCEGKDSSHSAREAAVTAYGDFYYVGNDSPKSVRRLIGLVGASSRTLLLARDLNDQKDAFAKCISKLQKCYMIDEREKRHPLVRNAFQQIKIARINTLQVTRKLFVVEEGLQKISWSICRKPRIKQITREEAIAYIRSDATRRIRLATALAALEKLRPKTLLARYRPGSLLAIANATYLDKWGKPVNRQYSSGMPLLIRLHPGESLPPCSPPNRSPAKRKPRPTLIERSYFVKALKLRRYVRPLPIAPRVAQRKQPLSQLFRGP